MVSINEALKFLEDALKDVTDEATNEAKIILSYLLKEEPSRLILSNKKVDLKAVKRIINRRKKGEPIQYILGKWWFYESEFYVGKGVLIPRQDTETLCDTALDVMGAKENLAVIDLCSGSGAIAISIAAKRKTANVVAVEKYKKAFKYLKKNIEHNKALNVTPIKADVLKKPFGVYDIIVSNPPYITKTDMTSLSKEVKHEPETALFGGNDGLDFYRAISANCVSVLSTRYGDS